MAGALAAEAARSLQQPPAFLQLVASAAVPKPKMSVVAGAVLSMEMAAMAEMAIPRTAGQAVAEGVAITLPLAALVGLQACQAGAVVVAVVVPQQVAPVPLAVAAKYGSSAGRINQWG